MHHLSSYDALMPTKNPRLTITLQPVLATQLKRLSELTGNSQSSMISELLEGSEQVFSRLISVLEAAKSAKDSLKGRLSADLEQAQGRMEAQLGLLLGELDTVAAASIRESKIVEKRARRAPGASAARQVPSGSFTPISNRGVRSTANPPKTKNNKA